MLNLIVIILRINLIKKSNGLYETILYLRFFIVFCSSSHLKTNFKPFFDYNYGNCYTFSGRDIENTMSKTLTCSNYGLTLDILTGDPNIKILT